MSISDPIAGQSLVERDAFEPRGVGSLVQQDLIDEIKEEDEEEQKQRRGSGESGERDAADAFAFGRHELQSEPSHSTLTGSRNSIHASRPGQLHTPAGRRPSIELFLKDDSRLDRPLDASGSGGDDDDDELDFNHHQSTPGRPLRGSMRSPNGPRTKRNGNGVSFDLSRSTVRAISSDDEDDDPVVMVRPPTKKEMKARYWRRAIVNFLFIAAWYFFATLISLYNKWMFSPAPTGLGFQFPLFVTAVHMIVQFILACLTLSLARTFRPKTRPNSRDYVLKAVPCGLATATDIGLSNLSLKTISLAFYTMCKSSTLAFVLLFAFLFHLEKPTLKLIGIIALITAGVVMMVFSEPPFVLLGFIEVMLASCTGGLRWALTQILITRDRAKMGMQNPIATIFWLAPIMALGLGAASVIIERPGGPWRMGETDPVLQERFWGSVTASLKTFALIVLPGCLAFGNNLAEFGLIQRTSVVTLSIAGIFKEVATIFLSSSVFGDALTPINISGLAITLTGIALYNWLKYNEMTTVPASPSGGLRDSQRHDSSTSIKDDRAFSDHEPAMKMLPSQKKKYGGGFYNIADESTLCLRESPGLGYYPDSDDDAGNNLLHSIGLDSETATPRSSRSSRAGANGHVRKSSLSDDRNRRRLQLLDREQAQLETAFDEVLGDDDDDDDNKRGGEERARQTLLSRTENTER